MLSFITERRQVLPVSVPLEYFGIDYDKLTKEQFVSLIEILKLSKYLKSPINQRGKARPQLPHGKDKKKRK